MGMYDALMEKISRDLHRLNMEGRLKQLTPVLPDGSLGAPFNFKQAEPQGGGE